MSFNENDTNPMRKLRMSGNKTDLPIPEKNKKEESGTKQNEAKTFPNYMKKQSNTKFKLPLLCRYFHHSYECPFELRTGKCSNIHETKVRTIFIWITENKEEGYTE